MDGTATVHIQVIGKQWSWDFNYLDADVYDNGQHEPTSAASPRRTSSTVPPAPRQAFPTLYLPVNETVEFTLDSRDVIHSFWIPAFLYKQDMIPRRDQHVPGDADP